MFARYLGQNCVQSLSVQEAQVSEALVLSQKRSGYRITKSSQSPKTTSDISTKESEYTPVIKIMGENIIK